MEVRSERSPFGQVASGVVAVEGFLIPLICTPTVYSPVYEIEMEGEKYPMSLYVDALGEDLENCYWMPFVCRFYRRAWERSELPQFLELSGLLLRRVEGVKDIFVRVGVVRAGNRKSNLMEVLGVRLDGEGKFVEDLDAGRRVRIEII